MPRLSLDALTPNRSSFITRVTTDRQLVLAGVFAPELLLHRNREPFTFLVLRRDP